ncbi:OLC1v1016325C1 [Oldenlandia corymbosa var. corymbosa]|uniref:OLC1v1016325C1 n=1 Tax=Oldenlandia corymbosa var. corymbosa TaxID=529605 RepID=A0AAV1E5R9_OLDCO|nr:OLC1v1016325C1 [Oldenlandia corymbosa var. corymbosa]
MSFNDHGHIRHSGPSHQVLGSSPLEHEEQCHLNSSGVDFSTTSKMKLLSIEGSSRNVFQDQKNESSDDNRVRQADFITNIASNVSNLSHQERGRLIMIDSDETKNTSLAADEMSKGSICNGLQHGAAAASAFVSSQFSQQDKSILMTLGVDQAETSTTTSIVAGEVSMKLICNDGDQTRQLDSSVDSVSLEQLGQDCLKTQELTQCKKDNWLKNDEAEIEVIKPIEERQVESQLKDEDRHLPEVRCDQPITFPLIFHGQDKKGSKKNDSGTVSRATVANPVIKQFGSHLQVPHNKMVTSPNNSQGQSLSTVTKEVKSKGSISGDKVQDAEKRKVSNASSSPISNGRFNPKSALSVNMTQKEKNHRIYSW